MRQLSDTSLTKISQRFGSEPIFVIGVNWFDLAGNQATVDFYGPEVNNAIHAGEQFYADRALSDYGVDGKVIAVNAIEDVLNLDGNTSATNISITLDDTDGSIKTIFDYHDIHYRQVNIYQYFDGIPFDEKFIIYEGVIESPITYSDNDRTITFALVSINEHAEAGFSPEEGQFPNLPASTIGQAWPMAFGSPQKVPGLTYQYPANGTILYPYYVVNSNLDVFDESQDPNNPANKIAGSQTVEAVPRNNYGQGGEIVATPLFQTADDLVSWSEQNVNNILAGSNGAIQYSQVLPTVAQALAQDQSDLASAIEGSSVPPPGLYSFIVDGKEYDEHDYTMQITVQRPGNKLNYANLIPTQNQSGYAQLPDVAEELQAKGARTDGVQLLNGGIGFPVGVSMTLSMNNHLFMGKMNASGFMKLTPLTMPLPVSAYYAPTAENTPPDTVSGPVFTTAIIQNTVYFVPDGTMTLAEYKKNPPRFSGQGEVNAGYKLQQGLVSDGFQLYDAGTQIKVLGDWSVDYIVNIIPTTITAVWGFKAVGNTKQLCKVPNARWTHQSISFTDIDSGIGVTAEIVRLNRLLSAYPGEGWEDGIYVDQTSTIGPNPIDIMIYLIEKFTPDLSSDFISFSAVAQQLQNYPMNFYISQKVEVIQLLQDIAYQCRCALFVKLRIFYIKYLSVLPTPDDTITPDDIIEGTIEIGTTETEQLITRLQGDYQSDYSTGLTNSIIVRNNIQKYGLWQDSHNFFCYTDPQYVQKSVTYWSIIRSNVWKTIKFSTNLNKLNLETFDSVTFNVPGVICLGTVICRITSTQYDSTNNKIDFECWVPVLLGTMLQYEWGYPASSSTDYTPLYLRDFDGNVYQDFRQDATGILATVAGQASNSTTNGGIDSQGLSASGGNTTNAYLMDTGEPTPSDADDQIVSAQGTLDDLVEPLSLPLGQANYAPDATVIARRKPLQLLQSFSGLTVPGQVQGQAQNSNGDNSSNVYNVVIYPNGLNAPATTVQVQQLQILNTEVIPSGTWVFVSQVNTGKTGNATQLTNTFEYYMQVPIWLGTVETDTSDDSN